MAVRFLFDGQSLMTTPTGSGVAVQSSRILPGISCIAVAVTSTTYADRTGTLASRYGNRLDPSKQSVLADLGGQSDLWSDMTAANLYTAALAYWNERRSAGVDKVLVCTIPHALNFALSGAQNTQRLAYNDLLRASGDIDGCVDLAADPRFVDWTNTTWFADNLHPTVAGASVFACKIIKKARQLHLVE